MDLSELMVVFWCCLGALCNSTLAFSMGILQNYIYSAFLFYSPAPELMHSGESVMHIFATIILMVGCGLCWTLGYIKTLLSPTALHTLAVCILTAATISLKWWYPTITAFTAYCVLNGYITGILHVYFSEVLSKLNQDRAGLFNGLYGFFFGCSGVLANLIAATYINPDNDFVLLNIGTDTNNTRVSPVIDPLMMSRTCNTWVIYGVIFAVCYIPGIYFISCRSPTSDSKSKKAGVSDTSVLIENESSIVRDYGTNDGTNQWQEMGLSDSFRFFFGSKEAYFYLSCTVSIGIASLVSSDLYKTYGMKVYSNDKFYNVAGTVVPIIGGTGRVVWGALYDHLSERCIFSFNCLLVTLSLVGMTLTRDHPYVYILLVSLCSSSLGTMSCLAPAIRKRFSTCSFSLILGLAMSGEVLGTLGYMLTTSVLTEYISDTAMLYILAAPPAASFLLALITL